MGGGQSAKYGAETDVNRVIQLMMPVYFDRTLPTMADIDAGTSSWNHILNDTCPNFLEKLNTPGFEHTSCISWFYDTFYSRLFDVHPLCR